jgi:ElaA protein
MRSGNMTHQRYPGLALLPLDTVTPMQPGEVTSRAFADLTATELHDILRLRGDVFVVEQACVYPDIDGRDTEPTTMHHWISVEHTVAAYARTLTDPDGATRIGRVVTDPRFRRDGLAARLVNTIVETSSSPLLLDAQSYLVEWYERIGFSVAGPEFIEDGIPHVPMTLE